MNWRTGVAASAIVAVLCVVLFRGPRAGVDVGFQYEEFPFTFSAPVPAAIGGPLTSSEIAAIKQISRRELTQAHHLERTNMIGAVATPWVNVPASSPAAFNVPV